MKYERLQTAQLCSSYVRASDRRATYKAIHRPKGFGNGHVAELTKTAHESCAGPQEVAHCAKPDLRSQMVPGRISRERRRGVGSDHALSAQRRGPGLPATTFIRPGLV